MTKDLHYNYDFRQGVYRYKQVKFKSFQDLFNTKLAMDIHTNSENILQVDILM